jgi:hypothetical protein
VERFDGTGLGKFLQDMGINPLGRSKGRSADLVPRTTGLTLTVPDQDALDQLLAAIQEGK